MLLLLLLKLLLFARSALGKLDLIVRVLAVSILELAEVAVILAVRAANRIVGIRAEDGAL